MHHGQRPGGTRERHVEKTQALRVEFHDARGLHHQALVDLESLHQRGRHYGDVVVETCCLRPSVRRTARVELGLPIVIRPSFTLGGTGGGNDEDGDFTGR